MTIIEMREKRAKLWNTMEGFLDTHRNDKGVLSAEDDATYSAMEQDLNDLSNEIRRMERKDAIEAELNKPVGTPIKETPEKADKLRQYESYAAGVTAKDVYLRNKSSADEQLSAIREEIDQCERSMAELEHTLPEEKSMEQEAADRFKGQDELTNEMALAFIEAVYIQPGGQVEIRWKFKDPLEKIRIKRYSALV